MILTSYLYVGVHYKKNNGVSSKLVPVSIETLSIQVIMTNCCWKLWTVLKHSPRPKLPDDGVRTPKHVERLTRL
jgi:hypothetical protein